MLHTLNLALGNSGESHMIGVLRLNDLYLTVPPICCQQWGSAMSKLTVHPQNRTVDISESLKLFNIVQ